MKGIVIKQVGGIYTVRDIEEKKDYNVKPIGVFRRDNITLIAGDNVEFSETSITKLYPRKNTFIRPKISNVDYALLLMSTKDPNFDLFLLDRFILNILRGDVEPIIIISKCDLIDKEELDRIKSYMSYYEKNYHVFYSDKNGINNYPELEKLLENKIAVLSGQTGAGKSHLLNNISPILSLDTGEISKALGRGRHTTRETTLYEIDNMYIADSPGFSSLTFFDIDKNNLKDYFIEFSEFSGQCKFNQCLHIREPECKVKEKVNEGAILKSRYNSYLKIYDELKSAKPVYRRK